MTESERPEHPFLHDAHEPPFHVYVEMAFTALYLQTRGVTRETVRLGGRCMLLHWHRLDTL